mmetsp:Transcript_16646/g.18016  ORF Transcript_16646/g.18016 Transcript_16646/m.18016 type:complete len:692 (+) Transcript_16646:75-2150(+)
MSSEASNSGRGLSAVKDEGKEGKVSSNPVIRALSHLRAHRITEIQFFLFGVSMIMGNRCAGWNGGLAYGLYAWIFNVLFAGFGYACLCLCMAEMSSTLPFSGGIFGFVRAALGPYNGFLVACSEFIYCTTYLTLKVQRVITIPNDEYMSNPVLICLIYGTCLVFSLIGGKPFFIFTSLLGFFVLMLLIIYLCGTISKIGTPEVSFDTYAGPFLPMTWDNIMEGRISANAQFNGMQLFPLLSGYLREPREQVPRVLLFSIFLFIAMSMFVTFASVSQDSGGKALSSANLPLQFGYARIFNMNLSATKWLDLPSQFGTTLCFFYCGGKQLHAISRSGLLPSALKATIPGLETPYLCYTLAAVVGCGLSILLVYNPTYVAEVRAVSLMASYHIFIVCFISYMVFRTKFSSMTRSFKNPLGYFAPIFGIVNYLMGVLAVLRYTTANYLFLVPLAGIFVIASVFFWTYLVKYQKFSEEEKKLMFKAYLINANQKTKSRLKNNKVAASSNNSIGSASNASKASKTMRHASNRAISIRRASATTAKNECGAKKDEEFESCNLKTEETRLPETNANSRADSLAFINPPSMSEPRHITPEQPSAKEPEVAGSTKLSSKIIAYLSGKLNSVMPAIENLDENDIQDYEQLAALSAGGVMNTEMEEALEARFGMDVESSEVVQSEDNEYNEEVVVVTETNDII